MSRSRPGQGHVSVSKETYARLKAFCELNNVSMSQLVEARVNQYLDSLPEDLLDEPAQKEQQT